MRTPVKMTRLADRYRPLRPKRPRRPSGVDLREVQDRILGGISMLKFAVAGTEAADLLLREAALLADLHHPSLVPLTDAFTETVDLDGSESVAGFATQWIDGVDLTATQRSLPESVALFGQLLHVVDYLHRRGFLHLDLKPENVLATGNAVTLLDLGSVSPLDAPPGQAGGTLGYAAPEVLACQAASIASDIYSLGVILYRMVSGANPHGEVSGTHLRSSVMTGDAIPVRLVASSVPPLLGALVDGMLARAAGRRPRSIQEVVAGLGAAGFEIGAPPPGSPPFVGRVAEGAALQDLLKRRTRAPVALVGGRGSGRSRLATHALAAAGPGQWLDLTKAKDPWSALYRLLQSLGADLPAWDEPWDAAAAEWLHNQPKRDRPLVFVGDLDALPAATRPRAEAVFQALARAGWGVLLTARRIPDGAHPLPVGRLGSDDLARLAGFLGEEAPNSVEASQERSGGLPGPFLRALRGHSGQGLSPAATQAWATLRTLPSGTPADIVAALPSELRDRFAELELHGFIRVDEAGTLHLLEDAQDVDLDPVITDIVLPLLPNSAGEPLWLASTAARAGDLDLAMVHFAAAVESVGDNHVRLTELARRLADHGHEDATIVLATQLFFENRYDLALEQVRRLPPGQTRSRMHVRNLRRAGRLREAIELAHEVLRDGPDHMVATDLAHALWTEGDLDAAEAAIEGYDLPTVRLHIAVQRIERGEDVPGIAGLLEAVDPNAVDDLTLAVAGQAHMLLGNLDQAVELITRTMREHDRAGALYQGCTSRVNLGNALQKAGRARAARDRFLDAERIARALNARGVLTIIWHNLADLELRLNRLPAAAQYLEAFTTEAGPTPHPQAAGRIHMLEARMALAVGDVSGALDIVRDLDLHEFPGDLQAQRAIVAATALLSFDDPAGALAELEGMEAHAPPNDRLEVQTLTARCHLALGRHTLASVRGELPLEPNPLERGPVGRALLASSGEDLDPGSFGQRRADLGRAMQLLSGEQASRAAALRERLLEAPGAELEQVVSLIEAVDDPRKFPEALAVLVSQALGAYRVLIMIRMPGLGQQRAYREISGSEAAGIGLEVLKRIREPDDVWRADDAFADPALREVSATVRTFEIKSLMAVAIPQHGRAIGALYVDDLYRASRFTEADIAMLQRLAAAIGRIVGLLPSGRRRGLELYEALGVLLADAEAARSLRDTLDGLNDTRQANVLLTGATGAGKTWLAQRLATDHLSLRGVVQLACGAIGGGMLVSTLSGTSPGDFTGAIKRTGLIQQAVKERNALFLDEVHNLDRNAQGMLLPLLELPDRRFGQLTGSMEKLDPLFVILGTNVDVSNGRWKDHFREDLWFRMNHFHIHLPTLYERGREVVYRYLRDMLAEQGCPEPEAVFDIGALDRVTTHRWPGNLRELHTFAEAAAGRYLRVGRSLSSDDLAALKLEPEATAKTDVIDSISIDAIMDALRREDWVQSKAARSLGMSKWRLRRLLERYELLDRVKQRRQEMGGGSRGPLPRIEA